MNKGPNQPQHPGNRGRRRHRRGKGQHNQPGSGGQQGMRGPGGQGGSNQNRGRRRHGGPQFVGPMDHSYRNAQGSGNEVYSQNGRYRGPGRSGPQQQVNGAAVEQAQAADVKQWGDGHRDVTAVEALARGEHVDRVPLHVAVRKHRALGAPGRP